VSGAALRAKAVLLSLLPTAVGAADAPHRIDVKVDGGFRVYSAHVVALENEAGEYSGAPGWHTDQNFSFSYTLMPIAGAFQVDFSLMLTPKKEGRGLMQTGGIRLRPGERKNVLACGPWKVDIGLDLWTTKAKKSRKSPEPANYWLSERVAGVRDAYRCRHVATMEKPSSVRDALNSPGGSRTYFSMGAKFPFVTMDIGTVPDPRTYSLVYTLEAGSTRSSSSIPLILDRGKSVAVVGSRLEFLLVREPPLPPGSALREADETLDDRGGPRLLR
jgi:hypothetical protein